VHKDGKNLQKEQKCELTQRFMKIHNVQKSNLIYKFFGNQFYKKAAKASKKINK